MHELPGWHLTLPALPDLFLVMGGVTHRVRLVRDRDAPWFYMPCDLVKRWGKTYNVKIGEALITCLGCISATDLESSMPSTSATG